MEESNENPVVRETIRLNLNNLFMRMLYFGNKHQIETTAIFFLSRLNDQYRKMRRKQKWAKPIIIVSRQITINTQIDTFFCALCANHYLHCWSVTTQIDSDRKREKNRPEVSFIQARREKGQESE